MVDENVKVLCICVVGNNTCKRLHWMVLDPPQTEMGRSIPSNRRLFCSFYGSEKTNSFLDEKDQFLHCEQTWPRLIR